MRTHVKGILGAALFIIALCFLLSIGCSWRIFSEGEVNKEAEISEDVLKLCPLPILEILRHYPGGTDDPDSVEFSVSSIIQYDSAHTVFVEMEVGELLPCAGDEPDTLLVDHRP